MASRKAGAPSLTYEEVYSFFELRGCELLSDIYVNNRQKLKYICSCGRYLEVSFKSFKQNGGRCNKCRAESRRLDIDYVRAIFESEGCDLIDKNYVNNTTPLKYRCKCGKISKISFANFQNGSRCYDCGVKATSDFRRHSYEFVRDFFKSEDCELLEKDYRNSNQRLRYRCKCGNISNIAFHSFRRGQRCRSCGLKKQGLATRGENHPNWNPKITDEDRKDKRLYTDYRIWRKSVYERDNYTCQYCEDDSGGNLNAHHIESYANHVDKRVDVSNGITLCETCHRLYHKTYGQNNANQSDFLEFMKGARNYHEED